MRVAARGTLLFVTALMTPPALITCRPAQAPAPAGPPMDLVVVAPHPDDETLFAGGILMAAHARGAHASVIVVTNGDFTCARDGHVREVETVRALALLGIAESDVHFLGYPDGWLSDLGDAPLPPIERVLLDGTCGKETGTYAEHGASGTDEHTARTGSPAPYLASALEGDLEALFERLHPSDVYVTHPLDSHPDHAATYAYVRRALETLGAHPRVHRAVVHGGLCWPNGRSRVEPCPVIDHARDLVSPMPPVTDPYGAYLPDERVTVADPGRKLAAIFVYGSQLQKDADHDWLTSFARSDEAFWTEDGTTPRGETGSVTLSPTAPAGDAAGYHLALGGDAGDVTLTRAGAKVRKWSLPMDAREQGHRFDVRVGAPGAGGVVEVGVLRDGKWLGVGVDPR